MPAGCEGRIVVNEIAVARYLIDQALVSEHVYGTR